MRTSWHLTWALSALASAASAASAASPPNPVAPVIEPVQAPSGDASDDAGQNPSARAFDAALGHFNQGDLALAAGLFYRFLHADATPASPSAAVAASVDVSRPESDDAPEEEPPATAADAALLASNTAWAHFFLGESLLGLQLYHAASVYFYEVVKQAAEPELVPRALARVKELAEARPVDTRLVYDNLLDATAFANLPRELSDWVEFEQGRSDIQRGFDNWGDRHLSNIDPNSPFAAHADYVRAVRFVRDNKDPNALALFEAVAQAKYATKDVVHISQLALARLRFDQGDYKGALAAYAEVRPKHLSFEEGLVLTEKAWTHYYLGHMAEALGALHALAAPSYESFFYPDVFLLRALIYKERCHFLSAKDVVRSFRSRFAHTFEQLRARVPQERIERVRRAAVMEGPLARRTKLLLNLTDERDRVGHILGANGGKLVAHITGLYETSIDDNDQSWRRGFTKSADAVSLRLLDTQEQINVLDYEISLAIFRPIEDVDPKHVEDKAASVEEAVLDPAREAIYPFDGEYWNDELADYQVMLPDRCLGESP